MMRCSADFPLDPADAGDEAQGPPGMPVRRDAAVAPDARPEAG